MSARNEPGSPQESIRVTLHLALWTLAWLATLAVAQFGPDLWWGTEQSVASWIAVAANLGAGVGWIVAIIRYLRGVDELQRKVMLEALGITLGVGWVAGFGYVVADSAGLVAYEVNLAVLPVIMGVVFLIAVVVGMIRYR